MEKDDKIKRDTYRAQRNSCLLLGCFVLGTIVLGIIVFSENNTDINWHISDQSNKHLLSLGGDVPHHIAPPINVVQEYEQMKPKGPTLDELLNKYKTIEDEVRTIKSTGIIMETDEISKQKTSELQDVARQLIQKRYGNHDKYRVKVDIEFPSTIPDYNTNPLGKYGSIVIEMAPIELIPVSVWTFLEVSRTFMNGAFHRNAGHVLQVRVKSDAIRKSLPFQEYSSKFPHTKGTCGYCGRPSGPCWYVSIQDNTKNHGPGSQQKKNPYEADSNFGTVVKGMNDVVPRIHTIPQREWLDKENQIIILKKTILIPDETNPDNFIEWKETKEDSTTTTTTTTKL